MAVKRQITLPFASRTDPISGKCGKLPFVENATKVSKELKDEAALAAIGARFWCGASSAEMDLVDL
jgi:hypothetical protein